MNIGAQRAVLAAKSKYVRQTFRGNVYHIKPTEISNVLDIHYIGLKKVLLIY